MFFARESELKELKEKLGNDRFEAVLIYGRRRIGKTELIKQAAKGFTGLYIYYECKRSLIGDNIDGLNDLLRSVFGVDYTFENIRSALKYVFERAKTEKILFVIDELPFMLNEDSLLVSDLRDLIDEYNNTSALKLILSGSYVDTMKNLNDGHSETYGRFTGIIELKAFDYYDSANFYPDYSDEDKFLMYSVFGGVAFFNSLIDPKLSAVKNIKKLLVAENSILQLEIEHTISAETSKVPLLNSVIELIGRGITKYTDIAQKLSKKKNDNVNPDYSIKKLIDLEIIEKVVPINDKNNKKRIAYVFKDNLMEFYYRYIFRNKNSNAILSVDDFYTEFIDKDMRTAYLPKKFEQISKEFLVRANKKHLIDPLIHEIGTYSFDDRKSKTNRQFDVVTKDSNGYISYECKFTKAPIDLTVIHEEEYQIKNCGIDFYKLGFISRTGFSEEVSRTEYNCIELKDFYNI